ncbi:N-6 DNA methylase [Paenibacillus sp. TC-CSREp1]|uniref:N-6 DNA methylase n=1 Tax=Paenibacillus sp. TC-CSREp1 TaxID=3410089 RepID=UPI003CFD870C
MTINMKPIQDIMRKDVGVDGDAQRISQFVWMIFLKILDDMETERELLEDYISPIPANLRWRSWAANDEGMTGDELVNFINNDLFPGLKNINIDVENPLAFKIRTVFEDTYNYMKSGTLIRQVINKINEIDFNSSTDRHIFNDVYEGILKELQNAGNAGEFYTPRAVTKFMVEMTRPKLGERILDPACGTGGFLICALEHLSQYINSVEDSQKLEKNLIGIEKKPLPYLLAITNLLLHNVTSPNIRRDNTLSQKPLKDYGKNDEVDVIITNPPFGGREEKGVPSNFPKIFRTNETADLFLAYIMKVLSAKGRAAIVFPDGSLFGKGIKTRIKEKLLEDFNLHTIVRLPKNVFAPYTDIATNLLFFERGKTKDIWYYEHQMPEGAKHYSKTKPITFEEFEPEMKWWNNRVENDFAWKVSIDEVIKRNYDLDFTNPNKPSESIKSPSDIIASIQEHQEEINKHLSELSSNLIEVNSSGKYPLVPLTELLERNVNQTTLDPNKTYSQVTVKMWGKGVVRRNEVKGSEIAGEKRSVVSENQLIFSKIDARNGAIGIVPDYLEGAVVSADFPSFDINKELVLPEYLEIVVKTPEFVQKCVKSSSGSTNRVRLKEKDFLDFEIPLPNIDEQEKIINEVQTLLTYCETIEHEISKMKENSDALKNSLLHELF